jgi:hypothetical protein
MVVEARAGRRVLDRDPASAAAVFRWIEEIGPIGLAEIRRLLGLLRTESEARALMAPAGSRAGWTSPRDDAQSGPASERRWVNTMLTCEARWASPEAVMALPNADFHSAPRRAAVSYGGARDRAVRARGGCSMRGPAHRDPPVGGFDSTNQESAFLTRISATRAGSSRAAKCPVSGRVIDRAPRSRARSASRSGGRDQSWSP